MKNRMAMKSDVLRIMHAKCKASQNQSACVKSKNKCIRSLADSYRQTDRHCLAKIEKKENEKRSKINRALKYVTIFISMLLEWVFDWTDTCGSCCSVHFILFTLLVCSEFKIIKKRQQRKGMT